MINLLGMYNKDKEIEKYVQMTILCNIDTDRVMKRELLKDRK